MTKKLVSIAAKLKLSTSKLLEDITESLAQINGTKNLPLWMERATNAPLSSVSADTLQGMRIALTWVNWTIDGLLDEEEMYAEYPADWRHDNR